MHARDAGQHSQRLDAMARKDDITKIQSAMQALSRTVSEKIQILEARVFEVESTNDQLQKEVGALTKENQALQDTVKLHEGKLKRTEKVLTEQSAAVLQELEYACFTKFQKGDITNPVTTASRSAVRFSVRKWQWLLTRKDYIYTCLNCVRNGNFRSLILMLSQPVDFLLYIFEIDIPVWSTNCCFLMIHL